MFKIIKIFITIVLGFFLIIIISALWASKPIKIRQQTAQQLSQQQPIIRISAERLFQEYKANEIAADKKYNNRTLIVYGTINSIGKDFLGNPYVTLHASSDYDIIHCLFSSKQANNLVSLSKWQRITIQGICKGKILTDVTLQKCILK